MNPFINRLRGLLAIGVLIWHIAGLSSIYPFKSSDAFQNALSPLFMFSGFNYVIGFIVLSGYCIARSTLSDDFNLARYALQRISRIYPSLIVCACIAGCVELMLIGSPFRPAMWNGDITLHNFIINILGLSGFYGQFGSYAPSYTVSLELLYYLIWGIVFTYSPKKLVMPISLMVAIALYFVLPANYRFALVLFVAWLIGATIAMHEGTLMRFAKLIPLWTMWLVVLIIFIWGNSLVKKLGISIWSYPGSLTTLPVGLLFGIVIACHLSRNGPRLQMDDWLGDVSYPLFLVHGPIIILVGSMLKANGVSLSFGPMAAILIASSLLAAQLVLITVERPVMRARRLIRVNRSIAPSADIRVVR